MDEGMKEKAMKALEKLGIRATVEGNVVKIQKGDEELSILSTLYVRKRNTVWVDRRAFLSQYADKLPAKALRHIFVLLKAAFTG